MKKPSIIGEHVVNSNSSSGSSEGDEFLIFSSFSHKNNFYLAILFNIIVNKRYYEHQEILGVYSDNLKLSFYFIGHILSFNEKIIIILLPPASI